MKKMAKPMKIITTVICVFLALILVSNLIIIVKGTLNPDRPPSVLGFTSMIVLTDSMVGDEPDSFNSGDLIITHHVKAEDLKVNDVITFIEPKPTGEGVNTVSHRIVKINEDGTFTTKGDNNNTEDENPVKPEDIVGKYWFKLSGMGTAAMNAKTPTGMLVLIGIPLALYIILDIILRAVENKKLKKEEAADKASKEDLEKQLAELKAKLATEEKTEETAEAETEEKAEETDAEEKTEE